jgi:hypothetical protein
MNILEPLSFDQPAEAQKFTRFHVCALCLGQLITDGLQVRCPEHGQMYKHTIVKRSLADQIESNTRSAKIDLEMFGVEPRDPETILKELGF